MFFRPQAKLGIGVKSYQNVVVMQKVDSDGLGAGAFVVGDIVLDVDGVPVKTTDETKNLILKAIQKRGFVSVVLMR